MIEDQHNYGVTRESINGGLGVQGTMEDPH
jgi:hypothetical protein